MRTEDLYRVYTSHPLICTDTRKIVPGCLFFALKGDRFDGNAFAQQALKDGAAYAVIDDQAFFSDDSTILVEDALTALQQLANYHRKQLKH